MNDRVQENNFKFTLYIGDEVINETIFNADVFNPVTRYSVDIRSEISSIISRLQKTLSRRNLTFKYDFNDEVSYDFLKEYKDDVKLEGNSFVSKLTQPETSKITINNRIISGVEFKFGLYINDNPIVERNFFVEGYNPATRFSIELSSLINDITHEIYSFLKKEDIKHMWDDYDLINVYGLYINQIRDLSKQRRSELLLNIKDRNFVKKTRISYKS